MASTRNLNTKYDYLCEKKQNNKMLEYMTDKTYGDHENPVFWDLGSNPSMYTGNIPITKSTWKVSSQEFDR